MEESLMKTRLSALHSSAYLAAIALGLAFLPQLTHAQPMNIAPSGTAILGYHSTDDNTLGTLYEHVGAMANVADGDVTTKSDTWGGAVTAVPYDFVGVTWGTPQGNLSTIKLTMATFVDGGWFGTPLDAFPPAGKALTPDDLLEPRVQFTVDGGVNWFDLPGVTSDYVTQLTGHNIGGGGFANPTTTPTATFYLPPLGADVDGVRLFGEGGGYAGADPTGFIGVYDLEVWQVPEPTAVTAFFAVAACLPWLRRRL
jgi:hypothetical protein